MDSPLFLRFTLQIGNFDTNVSRCLSLLEDFRAYGSRCEGEASQCIFALQDSHHKLINAVCVDYNVFWDLCALSPYVVTLLEDDDVSLPIHIVASEDRVILF